MATPRQGPLARIHRYRETSWGADPATPQEYLIPFITDGFELRQPRTPGVFYDGLLTSKGSYLEPITCQGEINTSLDYDYVGWDLMDVFGSAGYVRVGTFHRWTSFSNPLPHGIRKEFTQTTAIIHRYPGVVATLMRFAQATRGQQAYAVNRLGKGAEAYADIAGATLNDTTTKGVNSYFNGQLYEDNVLLGNPAGFDITIDRVVTPKEGAFTAGQLAAYSIGVPQVRGSLSKIFTTEDGDTFYLKAINETAAALICVYANKPVVAGPTKYLRFIVPKVLFDRMATAAGGDTIPDQNQTFYADTPDSGVYFPAHSVGTAVGPFNITAADNVFSAKAQGGATIDVVLTNGATRTAAQIAAELNLDGGFTAAFIAYDFMGRLEYRSLNVTSSSSVQWQTATANSAHTKLGFDTTVWTGYAPAPLYAELFNAISADFA